MKVIKFRFLPGKIEGIKPENISRNIHFLTIFQRWKLTNDYIFFRGYRRYNDTTISSRSSNVSPSVLIANNQRQSNRQRRPYYKPSTSSTTTTLSSSEPYKEYEFPSSNDGSGSSAENGFQYYIKKQYHEEERVRPDKAVGSFGYVDPFGIRRVVYYKADGQNGFVHRKNNRYVGHNAKPYDPLPIAKSQAMEWKFFDDCDCKNLYNFSFFVKRKKKIREYSERIDSFS